MPNVAVRNVEDKDTKYKCVKDRYNDRISNEEIDSSEVWSLTDVESGESHGLIMLTHEDAWKEKSPNCARLSHMAVDYNQDETIMWMYSTIEKNCIDNGIESISVSVPLNAKNLTKDLKSFLKRLGYKKAAILEIGASFSDANTECWIINNIKDFWEEGKGRRIESKKKR